jgi:hypothetical protein
MRGVLAFSESGWLISCHAIPENALDILTNLLYRKPARKSKLSFFLWLSESAEPSEH